MFIIGGLSLSHAAPVALATGYYIKQYQGILFLCHTFCTAK